MLSRLTGPAWGTYYDYTIIILFKGPSRDFVVYSPFQVFWDFGTFGFYVRVDCSFSKTCRVASSVILLMLVLASWFSFYVFVFISHPLLIIFIVAFLLLIQ